jgi:hypothetical protein
VGWRSRDTICDVNRPEPLDPTVTTVALELDEVHTNHLSPMGQVDDIGRFVQGVGADRLRRFFRIGVTVAFALVTVGIVTTLVV